RAKRAEKAIRDLQGRPPEIGADLIRYVIAVEDGRERSTIIATDNGDPGNPLYQLLETTSHV
ncbi:MAG: hypothetical protein M0017_10730, partial [Desulfobacteraceae bacterium]|nr:hypothetical protein [Desulfobacteraceae bacterium]